VDLGSGSGVLAITAVRLGWKPVLALDFDPAAVKATAENARRNGVALDVERHDLRRDPVERTVAPTVVANLLGPLLVNWAVRLGDVAEIPGSVVASGLLVNEVDRIAEAFTEAGLAEDKRLTRGEWAALILTSTSR
jgi:ribosomal protein L11 methyltransferase